MHTQSSKIPIWFWLVTILMLAWNLMGVMSFFQHILASEEAIQLLPQNERDLYGAYPFWTKIAFAIAVFGGTLGCVGLLLKSKWSRLLLVISLLGILAHLYHSLFISGAMEVYGPGAVVMPVMVILIALFLVWFAGIGISKGWLK